MASWQCILSRWKACLFPFRTVPHLKGTYIPVMSSRTEYVGCIQEDCQILPANDRQLILPLTQSRFTCSVRCYGTFLISGDSSSLGKAGMIVNLTSVWERACRTNSEKSRGALLGSGKSDAKLWLCLFHKHGTVTLQSHTDVHAQWPQAPKS